MRKLIPAILLVLVLSCSAAFAGTYSLTYAGQSWGGISTIYKNGVSLGNFYIGPYKMNVTPISPSGPTATMPLVCIDGGTKLTGGTWTINNSSIDTTAEIQAVYIAIQMINGIGTLTTVQEAAMQFAVWNLMDPGFSGTLIYTANNVTNTAIQNVIANMKPSGPFGYKVYWPEDPAINQPFVGVPEPSLIILLGLGLGAVGLIWGRFKS